MSRTIANVRSTIIGEVVVRTWGARDSAERPTTTRRERQTMTDVLLSANKTLVAVHAPGMDITLVLSEAERISLIEALGGRVSRHRQDGGCAPVEGENR